MGGAINPLSLYTNMAWKGKTLSLPFPFYIILLVCFCDRLRLSQSRFHHSAGANVKMKHYVTSPVSVVAKFPWLR